MRKTIKNVMLLDGKKIKIVIEDDKIQAIGTDVEEVGEIIMLPDGVYVSPGWIDLHTHAFPKFEPYCAYPDDIGFLSGVTTVVDAGSCGAYDIDEFYTLIKTCITRVFSFLNISTVGLRIRNELADLGHISRSEIKHALEKYPDFIVGLKARMSKSVVGDNGIKPLQLAKSYSRDFKKPVMVHIGSVPPKLEEILACLDQGDIITHCYHNKKNNHIFSDETLIENALKHAKERGVYLDVGHGTSSFSFQIAQRAFEEKIDFDSISTDIYDKNRLQGPVYNMATTLTKFLTIGYSLEKVISAVTDVPAEAIGKQELASFSEGTIADFTFFKLEKNKQILVDSVGGKIHANEKITPVAVMIGGVYYECSEHEVEASY